MADLVVGAPAGAPTILACVSCLSQIAGQAKTAILLTVLGFNLLGDGLREALDPKQQW